MKDDRPPAEIVGARQVFQDAQGCLKAKASVEIGKYILLI